MRKRTKQDKKNFYKTDRLDWIFGVVALAIVLFIIIGLSVFESVHLPLVSLLSVYGVATLIYAFKTGSSIYDASKTILKISVSRLGWFITMAF